MAASQLAANKTVQERRNFNPAYYELQTAVPPGVHVMIVDDTYTSGGHAQSVAMALKEAEAGKVSILTVARWLDIDKESVKQFYKDHIRSSPYDPTICPWRADNARSTSGGYCVPTFRPQSAHVCRATMVNSGEVFPQPERV